MNENEGRGKRGSNGRNAKEESGVVKKVSIFAMTKYRKHDRIGKKSKIGDRYTE
jgi:hypothetical protein